jgi:hypothetical protein
VGGGRCGLAAAAGAEPEAGQVAVTDVAGVGHLAVAHQVQGGKHGRECRERVR